MLDKVLFGESIPAMQQGMDAVVLRQKVVADNIANVATPGYQARHVAFEELLRGRQHPQGLGLATPTAGQIAAVPGSTLPAPRVQVDTSSDLRSGVNNVDVEREMAGLQRNSLVHAAMAQLISNKYKMIRQVIVDR